MRRPTSPAEAEWMKQPMLVDGSRRRRRDPADIACSIGVVAILIILALAFLG